MFLCNFFLFSHLLFPVIYKTEQRMQLEKK